MSLSIITELRLRKIDANSNALCDICYEIVTNSVAELRNI